MPRLLRPVPLRPARPRPLAAPQPPAAMAPLRPLPRPLRRPRRLLKLRSRAAPVSCSARRSSAWPFVSNFCQPLGLADRSACQPARLADFCEWMPALGLSAQKGDTPKPDLFMGSGFFFFPLDPQPPIPHGVPAHRSSAILRPPAMAMEQCRCVGLRNLGNIVWASSQSAACVGPTLRHTRLIICRSIPTDSNHAHQLLARRPNSSRGSIGRSPRIGQFRAVRPFVRRGHRPDGLHLALRDLQERLRDLFAPYLVTLNFDFNPNAYPIGPVLSDARAATTDLDATIHIDAGWRTGRSGSLTIPEPGLWPARAAASLSGAGQRGQTLVENDELQAALPGPSPARCFASLGSDQRRASASSAACCCSPRTWLERFGPQQSLQPEPLQPGL